MAKPRMSPPRGVIGAAVLLLVSVFLLAAGALSLVPDGDRTGPREAGAFILDPAVTSAEG